MQAENNLKELELNLKGDELKLRRTELDIKKWEAQNHAAEMHNTYMRENRGRVDGLVKGILLISGGALTLSLNSFLREHAVQILPEYIGSLKCAWGLLFASMVCAILVPLSLIFGAHAHGKRWLLHLENGKPGEKLKQPFWSDAFAWVFGLIGVGACCSALVLLAQIAVGTLGDGYDHRPSGMTGAVVTSPTISVPIKTR